MNVLGLQTEACSTGVGKLQTKAIDKGIVRRQILDIAWPSVTELIMVTLCQMVDMIMLGRLGSYAVAAVGLTSQPRFLMLAVFVALNVGTTAVVARLKGEGNAAEANKVVRQSLLLTICASIVISILGIVFSRQLVVLMGGEPETIIPGTNYFRIIMSGFVITTIPLCVTAALRGAGNTKASMYMNSVANVVNVIFNYLLINGKMGFPALGVSGAAIGTIIGYFAAFIMAAIILMRGKQYITLSLKDDFKPDFKVILRVLKVGLPAAYEQFAIRLGLLIYTRTVSSLGTDAFATHQICLNIMNLTFMNGQALGIAATTLAGQSLGRKEPELAKAYAVQTTQLGCLISVLIGVCYFFLGFYLVSLYTDHAEIIETGSHILKIIAFLQPFQSSQLILSGTLRGAGDTRWPAISIFIGLLIIRPFLSYISVCILHWGVIGAWLALAADQFVRFFIIYFRYRTDKWTEVNV